MIGLISGQVQYLMAPTACVMTTSGVGYDIELPLPSFCQLRLNEQASIWTHFHVREDAQLLYGFIDRKERDVFRQLIKICLLYTSPSPRDGLLSRMPSSA